jgi:short-subunit dehydrogenase
MGGRAICWSATPGSSPSGAGTITLVDFDRLFQTNVAGQLLVTQAAVAAMTDGGRIVLSSSVSVRLAVYQHALHAASKAAISARVSGPALSSMPIASEVTVFWTENTSRRMSSIRRRSPWGPSSATT